MQSTDKITLIHSQQLSYLTSNIAGKSSSALPQITRKTGLQASSLSGEAILLIPGALSANEANVIVAAAERIGFEHQGSKGPAHGEVLLCEHG